MQSYCQYVPDIILGCMASWFLCLAHKQNPRIPESQVAGSHHSERRFVDVSERNFTFLRGTTFQQSLNLLPVLDSHYVSGFRPVWKFNVDVFLYTPLKNCIMLHHFEGWNVSMIIMSSAGTAEVSLLKVAWIPHPKITASQRDFCNFNLPMILGFAIQNHQKKTKPWMGLWFH